MIDQTTYYSAKPLKGLDHLRAFAILFVFLFHYLRLFPHPDWLESIGKNGWVGVDLFFALSGYLISNGLFKEINRTGSYSWKTFFIKRAFKILPPFLLVLGIYFLIPQVREKESLAPLWKYLSFTQNFGLNSELYGTFSHAWSLCVEEQFYLLFPLILFILLKTGRWSYASWVFIGVFLFGFLIRWYSYVEFCQPLESSEHFYTAWSEYLYYPTYCRLDGLLSGVGLSAIFNFKPIWRAWIERKSNWLFILPILFYILIQLLNLKNDLIGSLFSFPIIDLSMATLVAIALCPGSILFTFSLGITRFISKISYSMYLIHKILIHLMQGQFNYLHLNPEGNSMFLICTLITILVSYLMYLIIEIPFQKLRNKLI